MGQIWPQHLKIFGEGSPKKTIAGPFIWGGVFIVTSIKDVPTSIPKSDLLCVTMAVIHVAGQRFLAV